ncbi:hypothetical protein BZA05DRAFT_459899 [Tricharina praecox]|uniref:uncharacterized protein n=1 Tax=Tricharina praecox TaxID=43433 RepID=UPI002220F1EF|nr:uncharacterized protein BZA05DRAFT_459899 [Tricharina praecox]KAI5856856.1 hypothetical protein BZA05DRAFT_459899 [Tricharina praecox]
MSSPSSSTFNSTLLSPSIESLLSSTPADDAVNITSSSPMTLSAGTSDSADDAVNITSTSSTISSAGALTSPMNSSAKTSGSTVDATAPFFRLLVLRALLLLPIFRPAVLRTIPQAADPQLASIPDGFQNIPPTSASAASTSAISAPGLCSDDPTSGLLSSIQTMGISQKSTKPDIDMLFGKIGLSDTHGSIFHFGCSDTKQPSKGIFDFNAVRKSAFAEVPSGIFQQVSAKFQAPQALDSDVNTQVVIYDASKHHSNSQLKGQKRINFVQERGSHRRNVQLPGRPSHPSNSVAGIQADGVEALVERSPFVAIVDKVRKLNTFWQSIYVGGRSWTIAPEYLHDAHQDILTEIIMAPNELRQYKFTLVSPSEEKLRGMQRCNVCLRTSNISQCRTHPGQVIKLWDPRARKMIRVYSCCHAKKGKLLAGCTIHYNHDLESLEDLKTDFTYQPTLAVHPKGLETKRAVVIKCCTGIAGFGRPELIKFIVIDFHTAEVLINMLVSPTAPILRWRTGKTGVTKSKMVQADSYGENLEGWEEARDLLCSYIDQTTVLIGEDMKANLDALRLTHRRVIDVGILIPKVEHQKHNLRALAASLLHVHVNEKWKDMVDDALAARELVFWVLKSPDAYMKRLRRHCIQTLSKEKRMMQRAREAAVKNEAIQARTKAVQSARRNERDGGEEMCEGEAQRAAKRVRRNN